MLTSTVGFSADAESSDVEFAVSRVVVMEALADDCSLPHNPQSHLVGVSVASRIDQPFEVLPAAEVTL